jgi:hypothetical protein
MAVYEYTARDRTGNEFNGSYSDVDSVSMLRTELDKMGYILVKTHKGKKAGKKQRIKQAEVVTFAYQFAGMCSAGLPIAKCLETLEEQAENPAFKCVIAEIRQNIEAGSSLKNAFEKHRKLFSDFFLGMVEAGESSSRLFEALNISAEYLEKRMDLNRRIRTAFAYPVFVGVVCLLVLTGLLAFVIPVFARIYEQLHVTLPAYAASGGLKRLDQAQVVGNSWPGPGGDGIATYLKTALCRGSLGCVQAEYARLWQAEPHGCSFAFYAVLRVVSFGWRIVYRCLEGSKWGCSQSYRCLEGSKWGCSQSQDQRDC